MLWFLACTTSVPTPADKTDDTDVQDESDADADADSDADADADTDSDSDADTDSDTDADTDTDVVYEAAERMVIMGDSWSTGLVFPCRDALDARGFTGVDISWETTANAGTEASEWVANQHPPDLLGNPDLTKPPMLDALHASLDASPPADILLMSLGGNDFNTEVSTGWGDKGAGAQAAALQDIQDDLQTLVDAARAGRPHLRIVFVGLTFFHFEMLKLSMDLDGLDQTSYNQGLVSFDDRRRAIASTDPAVAYTNNFGLLQHIYGDTIHPPFPIPNPLVGMPEYGPGVAPKPGGPPSYSPYPGGYVTYPPPLDRMPDGLHPDDTGFRDICDNMLDQVLEDWLLGMP